MGENSCELTKIAFADSQLGIWAGTYYIPEKFIYNTAKCSPTKVSGYTVHSVCVGGMLSHCAATQYTVCVWEVCCLTVQLHSTQCVCGRYVVSLCSYTVHSVCVGGMLSHRAVQHGRVERAVVASRGEPILAARFRCQFPTGCLPPLPRRVVPVHVAIHTATCILKIPSLNPTVEVVCTRCVVYLGLELVDSVGYL